MAGLADLYSPSFLEQLRRQATSTLQPTLDLGNLGIDSQATDVNRNYDTLTQQLIDAANTSTGTLQEKQNNFGLLSSGMTAAGLGKIQSDLSLNKGQAAQDKASKIANLALQKAQLATNFQSSVSDLVNKLLQGEVDKYKLTHPTSSGSGGIGSNTLAALAGLLGGGSDQSNINTSGAGTNTILPHLFDLSKLDQIKFFRSTGQYNNQEINQLVSALDAAKAGNLDFQGMTGGIGSQKVRDTLNEIIPILTQGKIGQVSVLNKLFAPGRATGIPGRK